MTKWKCDRCKDKCGFACDDDDLPVRCQLSWYGVFPDWHKVETVEEWLDLEDEPDTKSKCDESCLNCDNYIFCKQNAELVSYCLCRGRRSYKPKAKPEWEGQEGIDALFGKDEPDMKAKPDTELSHEGRIRLLENRSSYIETSLKERIEKLEEEMPPIDSCLGNHNGRIEKLEQQEIFDCHNLAQHGETIVELKRDVEELKKKAHEHPICNHEWSKNEPIIRCIKCGLTKLAVMYPFCSSWKE